jgi:hypothetical protein
LIVSCFFNGFLLLGTATMLILPPHKLFNKIVSPIDVMMESLYVERYAPIGEAFA